MFKVSDLNPNDRTLDEIHEIQKQIFEEEKELSWEEIRHRLKVAREEFCKTYKCRLHVVSLEKSQ